MSIPGHPSGDVGVDEPSAFAVNMADITRYAKNPRTAAIAQAFALPICITMSK